MNIQGITPAMTAPVQSPNAKPVAKSAGMLSSSSSGATGQSATSLQDTFLNLLVTELQNQDPTAPVDPTAMVGQLVSLNQLDQLISINQTLTSLAPGTPSTPSPSSPTPAASSSPLGAMATRGGPVAASTGPSSAVSAVLSKIQSAGVSAASTAALMNLYGSFSAPATTSNSTFTGGR